MWTVSKLNDYSISLVENGYVLDAINASKQALKILKMLDQEERQDPQVSLLPPLLPPPSPLTLPSPNFGVHPIPQDTLLASFVSMEGPHEDDTMSQANMLNMYGSAFFFNEDFCAVHKAETAAMLLFNLGLLNHLHGLRSVTQSAQRLQTALHLYKLAMSTIREHTILQSPLLTMALLTNMGLLESHFLRYREAKECLEGLKMCLTDPGQVNGLEEEEIQFFFFHLQSNLEAQLVVAPAA